jgi:predicted RNA binding protein YcfA (HicA-like mRNA interferase family)
VAKLPRITGRELVRALEKAGFQVSHQRGILRLAGLDIDDLINLL